MKKILSIILSLIITLSLMPLTSIESYAEIGIDNISGDGIWKCVPSGIDSTARIEQYYGDETVVVVPAKIEGYKISSIKGRYDSTFGYIGIFGNNRNVSRIIISYGIESVDTAAFAGCTSLSSIIIPDSVTSIGKNAFAGCTSLESVTIPDSVTSIDSSAFAGCTSLTSVTIPESVTGIGNNAFNGCTSLESITIPESVTGIGSNAFNGCTSLESITIPESVTYIGNDAFAGCTSLESVTIPDSITRIDSDAFYNTAYYNKPSNWEDDVLYIGNHLIKANTTISGIYNIKYDTKTIADGAFYNCTSLENVTISDSVTSIGSSAFSYCTSLESIIIPNSTISICDSAFFSCTSLESIIIEDGVTSIGYEAFRGCTSLQSITIPDSVTSIDRHACYDTAYYNNPSNWESDVLYIGNHLIKAKPTISGSYSIKPGTKTIANDAFRGCTSLENITIPDSVTSISDGAFEGCTSLESVIIGNGVTSIGEDAFYDCTSLNAVYINDLANWCNITFDFHSINSHPLFYAHNLYINGELATNIVIPDSVTSISDRAFLSCTSLQDITIPDSVTSIGNYAFEGCTSLQSITIPDSVTSIGNYAFEGCTSLQSITIPDSVTSIGKDAFYRCPSLVIMCYKGSYAHAYSYTFNYNFINIDENVKKCDECAFEYSIFKSRTCYDDGIKHNICKNCGYLIAQLELANGHDFESTYTVDKEATCTQEGLKSRHCTRCDKKVEKTIIPKLNHRYNLSNETEEIELPSSEYPESLHNYSNNSNEVWTYNGPENAVELELTFDENTQVESNYDYIYIYKLDGSLVGEYTGNSLANKMIVINDSGFKIKLTSDSSVTDYGFRITKIVTTQYLKEYKVDKEATCTEKGSKSATCDLCGYSDVVSINELGHDFAPIYTIDKEATCAETGLKSRHCTRCDAKTDITEIDNIPHNYGDYTVDKESLCTELGSKHRICTMCGYRETTSISALGHSYSSSYTIDKEATCTETGSKSRHCTRCDAKTSVTSIPALRHSYASTYTVDKQATCTEAGLKSRHCTRCDAKAYVTTILALGHSYGDWVVSKEPTCTETGLKSKFCTTCGNESYMTEIPKVAHKYNLLVGTEEITLPSTTYPELEHNYADSYDNIWSFNGPEGTTQLKITFSSNTVTESGYDYIYLYKLDGTLIGEFDGTSLSGRTITIDDSGFEIELQTDGSQTYYGFKIDRIVAVVPQYEYTIDEDVTETHDGLKSTYCMNCGYRDNITTIHYYGDWQIETEASGINAGIRYKECLNCGYRIEESFYATPEFIYVKSLPIKTTYSCGSSFNQTGLVVVASFGNGKEYIIRDYELSVPSMSEIGSKFVTVSYMGKEASFPIKIVNSTYDPYVSVENVNAKIGHQVIVPVRVKNVYSLSSLTFTIDYDDTKLSYVGYKDCAFENCRSAVRSDGTIKFVLSNSDEIDTDSVIYLVFDVIAEDECSTEISIIDVALKDSSLSVLDDYDVYNGLVSLNEASKIVKKIVVTSLPNKLNYSIGDEDIDFTGLVVMAVFEDGSTSIIDNTELTIEYSTNDEINTERISSEELVRAIIQAIEYGMSSDEINDAINSLLETRGIYCSQLPEISEMLMSNEYYEDEIIDAIADIVNYIDSINPSNYPEENGYNNPLTASCGSKIITIHYGIYQANFSINVENESNTDLLKIVTTSTAKNQQVKIPVVVTDTNIVALTTAIYYNCEYLEYAGYEVGDFDSLIVRPVDDYQINISAESNSNISNGTVVTLIFNVIADEGVTSLNADVIEAYNEDLDDVLFTTYNGFVTITDDILGDIDLNGEINENDYALLLANVQCSKALTEEQKLYCDLNHDGAIDAFDVIVLDLYLNGVCDINGNYI